MKTGYKVGRRVAYVLVAVGLVMAVVGIFMGASWHDANVNLNYIGIRTGAEQQSLPQSGASGGYDESSRPAHSANGKIFLDEVYTGVTSLEFDVGMGEVTVVQGDTFSIRASGEGREFTSGVENGVWKIYARGYDSDKNGYWMKNEKRHYIVTITLPKDFVAEEANIDMGMGSLEADTLAAAKATINVGMGDVDIDKLTCQNVAVDCGMGNVELGGAMTGSIDISCSMGNVEMDIDGNEQDYGYTASVGMGEINIGSVSKLAGLGGDSSSGADRPNQLNIDCGMGSVDIDFN